MEKVTSDFTSVLKSYNESFDQNFLEFRSLESNSIKLENRRKSGSVRDKSYSEEVKAFIQRVIERRKVERKNFPQVNSSTPFKICNNANEIDISGIAYLDIRSAKTVKSLDDSDFESMEQDNYDDSKENIELENKINESKRKSKTFCGTPKSANKKTKNSRISPHKSRKWKKFAKTKLRKYLMTNNDNDSFISKPPSSDVDDAEKFSSNYIAFNTSLDLLTEQLHLAPCDTNCNAMIEDCEINNESLCEFAFSHPNMTKTSEASIKNLSQLVSNFFLSLDFPSNVYKLNSHRYMNACVIYGFIKNYVTL